MPAVPVPVRRERAARLRAQGVANAASFHAGLVGRSVHVLTETAAAGHTEHFAPVRLGAGLAPATLALARVVSADASGVVAEAA
jgi:threonylcarbamoyladenosine tRNA methylthiotransferase MtaB